MDQHRCRPQYLSQRAAQPPLTIAQEISPPRGETHQAPVLLPPAEPVERQLIVGPTTRTCPCSPKPVGSPTRLTRASLASIGCASGHGWPALQVPSISRAAIPDSRTRGPSSHHTGPSPSQTATGVQANDCPAGTTTAERKRATLMLIRNRS